MQEFNHIFDRIEAAWKRQEQCYLDQRRDAMNMAGHEQYMRDALENALTTIRRVINGTIVRTNKAVFDCRDKIKAALADPPRNCDRFADELDAQLAFLNEVWLITVDRETMLERDKYENWSGEMKTRYGRWLLAPAAEKRGRGETDYSEIHAVCRECATAAGFVPKDKVVGVWTDECGICHKRKPCTALHHDWRKAEEGCYGGK